jgi:long-subunit acyl-CoA synthetase (AMP-forming)
MRDKEFVLPLEMFYTYEKQYANRVWFRQPLDGRWNDITWHHASQEIRKMAQALKNLNLPAKSNIAILSKNCAHWIMTDLAIWMAGHVSVPLYPTLTSASIKEILEHSQARMIFAGKLDDWPSQKMGIPPGMTKICYPHWRNEGCVSWDDFVGATTPMNASPNRDAEDIATLIYTSGTTGRPKGVIHTFHSMAFPVNRGLAKLGLNANDKFFSYLPLSHVAERLLIEIAGLYAAGTISFAESVDTFADNLRETQPTVFLAVPRIWTKFQLGILNKMPQQKLDRLLRIPLLSSVVKSKIKKGLGLHSARLCLSGAAPISPDLIHWFQKVGITILEAYGMTENFCYTSINLPGETRVGTVGKAWPQSEIAIAKNGEILLRSEANMKGYFREPEMTAEMMDSEGWIHSGDQGELDSEGYLKITGRVKDLFKTSKGKYVAPAPIESRFSSSFLIEQVCVMGSGLPHPIALVSLSDVGKKFNKEALVPKISELLNEINQSLEHFERLGQIVVVNDDWSTQSGVLTPSLKIKRNVVEKMYAPKVDSWLKVRETVIFL